MCHKKSRPKFECIFIRTYFQKKVLFFGFGSLLDPLLDLGQVVNLGDVGPEVGVEVKALDAGAEPVLRVEQIGQGKVSVGHLK